MTGHGTGVSQTGQVQVLAEIRSVNNRFLKITVLGDFDAAHQAKLDAMLRSRIQRGAVTLRLQIHFLNGNSQFQINLPQVRAYREQLAEVFSEESDVSSLLLLPGIVSEVVEDSRLDSVWPEIEIATNEAIRNFIAMRAEEGQTMLSDLLENCDLIASRAKQVSAIAPQVANGYAKRITERINRLLDDHDVSVSPTDLIREIGVFAERADISEELVRLASHIDQFRTMATSTTSDGKKLDFLTQELLRETNTMGSKANDAEIANHVVEMKAGIERIREMVQNIE